MNTVVAMFGRVHGDDTGAAFAAVDLTADEVPGCGARGSV